MSELVDQNSFLSCRIDDPEVEQIFKQEYDRQRHCINLIASENYVSRSVLEATGSIFTNKYAEGYPGRRYYGGCANMDAIEQLAIDRAKKLFGAQHANVQPHSGSQANTAVYLAVLEPGDTILSLDVAHGGHLTAGLKVNISGKLYKIVHYTVDRHNQIVDMNQVRKLADQCKPRLIICGASAYPRTVDFKAFAEIAQQVGAYLMSDIAHIAGLVVAGLHPSPVPVSDFVTSSTHKTLRGPRGGLILCKQQYAKVIDAAVFPGSQGGPQMHSIAGKAVAFGQALKPEFKQYQQRIIENAKALAEALKSLGYHLVSGGTENHLMLVDLRSTFDHLTGIQAQNRLEQANIVANKNLIPFDTRSPRDTSGLRFGTPAVTSRGLGVEDMTRIAQWIDKVLKTEDQDVISDVAKQVKQFCEQLPIYPQC